VFRAMFLGPLAAADTCIEISDITPSCFILLLRYIYSDQCVICENCAVEMLYASTKYMLRSVADKCITFLVDNTNLHDVCMLLEIGNLYSISELISNCWDILRGQTGKVLASDNGILALQESTLNTMLDCDILNCTESALFEGVMAWANNMCKKTNCTDKNLCQPTSTDIRQVLGPMLYKLRLPCVPLEELDDILPKGLLSEKELVDIRCHFQSVPLINNRALVFNRAKRRRFKCIENYCNLVHAGSISKVQGDKMYTIELNTPEMIKISSVDILDIIPAKTVTTKFIISIIQKGETVQEFRSNYRIAKRMNVGKISATYRHIFPLEVTVGPGLFSIGVQYSFGYDSVYGEVTCGSLESGDIECDGFTISVPEWPRTIEGVLTIPNTKPCYLAGFQFSIA